MLGYKSGGTVLIKAWKLDCSQQVFYNRFKAGKHVTHNDTFVFPCSYNISEYLLTVQVNVFENVINNNRNTQFRIGISIASHTQLIFLCCPIVCLYVLSFVLRCPLGFPHRIKTMFGSSLPPSVCMKARVLFTLFVYACAQWCSTHIVLCFCFVFLRLVSLSGLSICIAPSIFSNVY